MSKRDPFLGVTVYQPKPPTLEQARSRVEEHRRFLLETAWRVFETRVGYGDVWAYDNSSIDQGAEFLVEALDDLREAEQKATS